MSQDGSALRRVDDPVVEKGAVPLIPADSFGSPLCLSFAGFCPVEAFPKAFEINALLRVHTENISLAAEVRYH
jgi:hypothetical protein